MTSGHPDREVGNDLRSLAPGFLQNPFGSAELIQVLSVAGDPWATEDPRGLRFAPANPLWNALGGFRVAPEPGPFVCLPPWPRRQPAPVGALLVFWTAAGIVIGTGILNQRGIWAPVEESTRSYLRPSLERSLRREELSRFSLWLMAFWFVAGAHR